MSRSRRKHPIITSGNSVKKERTLANKNLRRKYHYNTNEDDTIHGKIYKKFYQQWDIHEYKVRYTLQDIIDEWFQEELDELNTGFEGYHHARFKTLKNYIRWWKTHYLYR